jgi:hypothetical protein
MLSGGITVVTTNGSSAGVHRSEVGMSPRVRSVTIPVVLLGLSASIGCGKSAPQFVPVSGTVTLDGQPLAEGFLYFKTIETGALERFDINNGEFKGKAQVGTRRVEICANRPKAVIIDGANVEVPDNIIHPSFNTQSTLTAQVTPEGPNRFTFDVKKK